jgi:thioesterase domain-containing protein
LELIREYSPRVELLENVKNTKELGRLWISLADYLEASNYDVEIIKKTIAEFGVQALPNFQQLNIKEAIYYLNLGRTLRNARAKYQPSGKIYTNVHYFAASESKNIKKEYWKQYNSGDIMFYEIEGDHFSIFKIPGIAEFARKFATVLENI